MEKSGCEWPLGDALMMEYHNHDWGVPVHDDQKWFEVLLLDGFQAGLSWRTILHKRENFREAFDGFDYKIIATYDERKITELLNNKGIIRNKLKVRSAVTNAQAFIKIQQEFGNFDKYIWQFTGEKTIQNNWKSTSEIPASSAESDAMSKDLKKRGFKFVGTTICYAFMQGAGMVNDHVTGCPRHSELQQSNK